MPLAAAYDMVDYPEDTAKFLAKMVRRGLRVERVPLGSVDIPADGCQCYKSPVRGLPLFAEVSS